MSTVAKVESSPLTEQPKRKRGRPRKLPQESSGPLPPKKPRGRPKGSKELSASGRQKVQASAEKKPRGRPRKWLVIQEEEYPKASPQGSSQPRSSTQPATAGTSVKGSHKTKELQRSSNTSPAEVHQQSVDVSLV